MRIRLKDRELNPAEVIYFWNEWQMKESMTILNYQQLLKKSTKTKYQVRNLKRKEWNTLSKLDRGNRIIEVEIIDNPVSKYQKKINYLIKEYEDLHNNETNFDNELQKRAAQPGFEFLNCGPKVMSKFK